MTIKCFLALFILTVQSSTLNRVITTLMQSKSYVKPTTVNGKPALYGEVPYLVSLKEPVMEYTSDLTLWRNLCVGSIISRRAVLTAAHCFEDCNWLYAHTWHLLRVAAGAGGGCQDVLHLENSTAEPAQQWRKIEKLVIHEHYAFPNFDIALILVDKDFIYNDAVYYIPPARLHKGYYGACKSAGFGLTGYRTDSKRTSVVFVADIETLPSLRCSQLWEMNMSSFICSKSAVADVGLAFSGGPLACYDRNNATEIIRRSFLTGIVGGRNFDNTTLYTRVSAYGDWISKHNGLKKMYVPSISMILIVMIIKILITLYAS